VRALGAGFASGLAGLLLAAVSVSGPAWAVNPSKLCGPGGLSVALDGELEKVAQARRTTGLSTQLATGVEKSQGVTQESFTISAEAGAIPPGATVRYVDEAGKEQRFVYLRTETHGGQPVLVFRKDGGGEGRIFAQDVADAQPGSIRISGGTPRLKPQVERAPVPTKVTVVDEAASTPAAARTASVDAASTTIPGAHGAPPLDIHFPAVTYVPPNPGQSAQAMAEAELGFPLGKPMASGGMRRVFTSDRFPGKVIKVFDSTLQAKKLSPQTIAKMIQRELAMEDFLVEAGVRVARIDRSPAAQALWKRGIIIQDRADGHGLWGYLGDDTPRDFPKVDEFMSRIRRYDEGVHKLMDDRYGIRLSVSHDFGGDDIPVGIDVGSQYSNIHVDADGNPIMIDW
jgi:hypothetical protein